MSTQPASPSPSIRRILVPSDLSRESDRALDHARLLAARFGAHVTLYHALEIPGPEWVRAAGTEEELRRRLAAEATLELERRGRSLPGPHDVIVEPDVSAPAALVDVALLRLVQASRPDLIVMGTHSRGALGAFFLGSVTQEVLRHAGRPVLVVGPGCAAPPSGYARILLPTDLSDASRAAFPIASLLARAFDAEVIALHAVPRPLLAALADDPYALAAAVPSVKALRAFVADLEGVRVTPRVEQGPAWDRIVAMARVEKADLIVMATRGADSLGDRILGSQTERVIRHAGCPVLAV
jgi:nucleotide-binding universal stress UspA family protein